MTDLPSVAKATAVTALADELTALLFDAEPLLPVVLGVEPERIGLTDVREETEAQRRRDFTRVAERAEAMTPTGLSSQDRVTRDVIVATAKGQLDQLSTRQIEFTVTDYFTGPASALLTFLPMIRFASGPQADAHLERLAAIPEHLEQVMGRHRAGLAAGRTPVERGVRNAIDHLARYLAEPSASADDPLLRQPAPDEEFGEKRQRLLDDTVRPAFAAYRDALQADLAGRGRPDEKPGVCHLPDGENIYAATVRVHTTTDRAPAGLHATGLELIEKLADEYAEIGSRVFGTSDVKAIFHRLRTDPALRWGSADELLDSARAAITRAEAVAGEWFGRVPEQKCVVEPVPAAEAPSAAPAYYMLPAADGSRPGTYFANTHEVRQRFRQAAESTAFHEAVPGHHFQLSLALGLTDLPLLRRIGDFNAYSEGWGLYSERLAHEMGLYSDDVALLGMLTADSMRAGRLVVDTGLHALGWTRQQAIDYLLENTPMSEVEIVSEVDRYIACPGQALSYMVGRLEFERLRSQAAQTLGSAFDIRAFHDLVLGGGALPLSVLDDVVTEWTNAAV